jgi:hypothetical protein
VLKKNEKREDVPSSSVTVYEDEERRKVENKRSVWRGFKKKKKYPHVGRGLEVEGSLCANRGRGT